MIEQLSPEQEFIFENMKLRAGDHDESLEYGCAIEIASMMFTGMPIIRDIPCLSSLQSVGISLTDGPWKSNEHRDQLFRPLWKRFLTCRRDDEIDKRISIRLVEYTMKTILVEVLREISEDIKKWGDDSNDSISLLLDKIEQKDTKDTIKDGINKIESFEFDCPTVLDYRKLSEILWNFSTGLGDDILEDSARLIDAILKKHIGTNYDIGYLVSNIAVHCSIHPERAADKFPLHAVRIMEIILEEYGA